MFVSTGMEQRAKAMLPMSTKFSPEEGIMVTLAEECKIARSMGLTYGKYKALVYLKENKATTPAQRKSHKSKRRYTDEQAFALWQAGKNDCEIGAVLGVSRQIIQRWRDTMELPSTVKDEIDTSRYHLVRTNAGIFVVCGED